MKTTRYFATNVMARCPYLGREWIESVLRNSLRTEMQANGLIRRWALIPDVGKYLRGITEADRETVHNVFFDRRFRP
jgi:hypothetical protein